MVVGSLLSTQQTEASQKDGTRARDNSQIGSKFPVVGRPKASAGKV
jgi:hypothetical protein